MCTHSTLFYLNSLESLSQVQKKYIWLNSRLSLAKYDNYFIYIFFYNVSMFYQSFYYLIQLEQLLYFFFFLTVCRFFFNIIFIFFSVIISFITLQICIKEQYLTDKLINKQKRVYLLLFIWIFVEKNVFFLRIFTHIKKSQIWTYYHDCCIVEYSIHN